MSALEIVAGQATSHRAEVETRGGEPNRWSVCGVRARGRLRTGPEDPDVELGVLIAALRHLSSRPGDRTRIDNMIRDDRTVEVVRSGRGAQGQRKRWSWVTLTETTFVADTSSPNGPDDAEVFEFPTSSPEDSATRDA